MLSRFKDFFIPHEGNNYRPDFLERMSVGIMLVLILLSFAMANLQALLWISSDWLVSTILPSVIVDLTNDERDNANLPDVVRNPVLDAAAKMKAEHMAENEYFAHYSPGGTSPWHWFEKAGYNYWNAGENLAVHFTESGEVVDAWMNSPSHRANIMSNTYSEIGVGTAKGEYKGYKTIYVVQLFGTPRKVAAAAAPVVAGAASEEPESSVTVEKIAVQPEGSDVAPATTETLSENPPAKEDSVIEPVFEAVLEEAPSQPVILVSDMATTAREGEPAPVSLTTVNEPELPLPLRSATQSGLWLSFVYAILASIVLISLIASLIVEWRRHHPLQSLYAGGLLTVMALLLYIHLTLTQVVVIV